MMIPRSEQENHIIHLLLCRQALLAAQITIAGQACLLTLRVIS